MIILICMTRTRTFDPATALTEVVNLFAAKGYSETSMEDIVRATGVSRYGIYGTFGNKRELFEQALERYAEQMGKASFVRLTEPGASLEHIRSLFAERIAELYSCEDVKGCMFIHTAMELAPGDADLREVLQRFIKRMMSAFRRGLESAQARGEVKPGLDARQASAILASTMFGIAVLGRMGFPKETVEGIVDCTLAQMAA